MSVPSPIPSSPQVQKAATPATPTGTRGGSGAGPAPITTPKRGTTSRSIGFAPSSATENSWREREMAANGDSGSGGALSPGPVPGSAPIPGRSGGPEKTVGGFEKKDLKNGDKDKDKGDKEKANLSHVPCRFFKQGACTAGANCPFSHSMAEPGKKEVCSWFLKGNCKFGHKCALAHVRPGEPISMDRKNKKDQQREQHRDKEGGGGGGSNAEDRPRPTLPLGSSPDNGDSFASPVPIKSALSSSIQSPPPTGGMHQRHPSSPMREPFGPPSAGLGAGSAGFGKSPGAAFASSPSRPSPLSASFSGRPSVPGPLALKSSSGAVANHSPLRPPTSAQSAMYSSSFSHNTPPPLDARTAAPLSASFADGGIRNIWARSEMPAEPLSPRRPILHTPRQSNDHVFAEDDDDHGEDFLPASLNDLLTPQERARRLSRRDSNDSYGASPARGGFLSTPWSGNGPERLAQSAGANLGPANFLQSLWSNEGGDRRRGDNGEDDSPTNNIQAAGQVSANRQSLLTQSKSGAAAGSTNGMSSSNSTSNSNPTSGQSRFGISPGRTIESNFPLRNPPHPSSPSARALNEHAPGQSLPGGVAAALSRLHLHDARPSSGLSNSKSQSKDPQAGRTEVTPPMSTVPLPHSNSKKDDHDDGVFSMDG